MDDTNIPKTGSAADIEFKRIADEYARMKGELDELDKKVRQNPNGEDLEKLSKLQIQVAMLQKIKEEALNKKIASVLSANGVDKEKFFR